MHSTIAEARMALAEVEECVRSDAGEDAVEAGWHDLVQVVADECTPEVRAELLRMEGVER